MSILYKVVPDDYEDTYNGYFDLVALNKKYNNELGPKQRGNYQFHVLFARKHPVTFAYYMLGKKMRMYQAYAIDMILRERRVALDWARRLGKEQPYSSKVLTPFGFKEMGKVQKDDQVIAADGSIVRVLQTFEQGIKDVYKLSFDDGSVVECGIDHLWKYQSKKQRSTTKNFQVGSLKQILSYYKQNDTGVWKMDKGHYVAVPLPGRINLKNCINYDKIIDPYILGCLIGDGGITTPEVILTSADEELIEHVNKRLPFTYRVKKHSSEKYRYSISKGMKGPKGNIIMQELKKLNLHGCKSEHKFIPWFYMNSSFEERLALLRGLMDTDGSVFGDKRRKGVCIMEYCTVSELLAKGVVDLVRSLGGKATCKFFKNNHKGRYRIHVRFWDLNPFLLSRKAKKYIPHYGRSGVKFLREIELVRKEQSKCIVIDHPDSLYITDDFTVTHNSTIVTIIAFWLTWFNLEPKNQIEKRTEIGIVSKEDRAAKKLLQSIRDLIFDGDIHLRDKTGGTDKDYFSRRLIEPNNKETLTWDNKCCINSLPPTKKVRGFGFSRLFIDEIAFISPTDSDPTTFFSATAKPTIADTDGYLCISSTPNGKVNLFHDLFDPDGLLDSEFNSLWFTWKVNMETASYVNYVKEEEKRLYNEGKFNVFKQEFLGEFTVTETQFFDPDKDIAKMFNDNLSPCYEWKQTGCSVGYDFGIINCSTVLTVKTKYKNKIRTLYRKAFPKGYDLNELMNPSNEDSFQKLKERYNVTYWCPEWCVQSDMIIKWMLREGYALVKYSFHGIGDKNKAYYTYRMMMRADEMECYTDEMLKHELTGIQEEKMMVNVRIGKPPGGSDDLVDSDVYATIPFFDDDDSGFGIANYTVINSNKFREEKDNYRRDTQWENLMKAHKDEFDRCN